MATLRDLAQRARNRLRAISNNIEENKPYSEACLSACTQYAIIANNKKIEDDPLYNKIKRLIYKEKEENIFNPLAHLIEHNIYDNLTDVQKEKYMYKLSKRYQTVREYILRDLENNL